MSYDFLIFRLRDPNVTPAELSEEKCLPFGTPKETRDLLAREIPGLRWNREFATGNFGFYTEFIVTERSPTLSIAVNGSTEPDALAFLRRLCKKNGWAALDMQTVQFLELDPSTPPTTMPPPPHRE